MRATEFLAEGATPILFHYAGITAARDILRDGVFKLSSTTGNPSEAGYAPKGYQYFLSTTRSKVGDYHRFVGSGAAMFVLDGDWFAQRYPVKPIDYWERSWIHSPGRTRESEDRVFSRDNTIPIGGVREIHILMKEQSEVRSPATREMLITAKQRGIPTFLYMDETAWRLQDTRRAVGVKQAAAVLRGPRPSPRSYRSRNFLEEILEMIFKKNKSELTAGAKKRVQNLLIYGSRHPNEDDGLGVDMSNARKPGSSDYDSAVKINQFMRIKGLKNTVELKNFLVQKWEATDFFKEDAESPIKFDVHTPDNFKTSFQIKLTVHGKNVGQFSFVRSAESDDVNNEVEVESRFLGQGYGKLLLLKAIETANDHRLDFQQDIRGITDAQQRVYDSLESAGLIVTPGDGFWFLTPSGEHELDTLNKNINEAISRRGFLRGLGGAALAGAGGSALAKSSIAKQVVEPGDTVYSIARQNGTTPQELFKLNHMNKDTRLTPGQQVAVPDTGPEPVQTAKAAPTSSAEEFASAIEFEDDISKIATGKLDPKMIPKGSPAQAKVAQYRAAAKPKVQIPQAPGSVPWQDIYQYCRTKWRMSKEQIAGMLANIKVESRFFANDEHMDSNGLPAGGLFSHNGPRLTKLKQALGPNWKQNWQGQIDFALTEPDGANYRAKRFPSADLASKSWTHKFERPAQADIQAARRAPAAVQYASNI